MAHKDHSTAAMNTKKQHTAKEKDGGGADTAAHTKRSESHDGADVRKE